MSRNGEAALHLILSAQIWVNAIINMPISFTLNNYLHPTLHVWAVLPRVAGPLTTFHPQQQHLNSTFHNAVHSNSNNNNNNHVAALQLT
jgi:hypothetical protein